MYATVTVSILGDYQRCELYFSNGCGSYLPFIEQLIRWTFVVDRVQLFKYIYDNNGLYIRNINDVNCIFRTDLAVIFHFRASQSCQSFVTNCVDLLKDGLSFFFFLYVVLV